MGNLPELQKPPARHPLITGRPSAGRDWIAACTLVIGIKLAVFFLDPMPQFFQGDSNDFIWTSLTGDVFPIRSFTYGYVIALLTRCSHSLTSLVFAQCIAGAGTALLVYRVLKNHFRVTPWLAVAAACCCALDPMQLFYERAVMAEAFSTFLFALGLNLALSYCRKTKLYKLPLLALICTAAIALRLALLLATLVICLFPPLYQLATKGLQMKQADPGRKRRLLPLRVRKREFLAYLTHLAVVCACLYALHCGYKQLNSKLSGSGIVSYMNGQGLLQICGIASIVVPEDAPDPRIAAAIRNCHQEMLRDRQKRAYLLFKPDGLAARLQLDIPDPAEREKLCKQTVKHAMLRAPLQVLLLGLNTWLDYFHCEPLDLLILKDQGATADLPEAQLQILRKHFLLSVPADWGKLLTVTKRLQFALKYWNYALMITPLIGAACVCLAWRRNPAALLVLSLAAFAILPAPCVFTIPVLRYLHPFGFLLPVFLAVLLEQVCEICGRKY